MGMTEIEKEVTIMNTQGLHARPAALFVQIATKYDCTVTVKKDTECVNGKSIMGILMLGAQQHSKIKITTKGEDAKEAMAELEDFLIRNE